MKIVLMTTITLAANDDVVALSVADSTGTDTSRHHFASGIKSYNSLTTVFEWS